MCLVLEIIPTVFDILDVICSIWFFHVIISSKYELGDIKGVGNFEATFWVEGLHFAPISMYRYIGEWLYYNFAARSFHKKKLCSRLYSTKVAFYSKMHKKSLFLPPIGGLRGNVHALHL